MKKKFTVGLGLITLIFVLSGLFIFENLDSIAVNEKIRDDHEAILNMYLDLQYRVKNAQLELYRRQAWHGSGMDPVAENLRQCEDILSRITNTYSIHKDKAFCRNCHALQNKIETLDKRIDSRLSGFKQKIGFLTRVKDPKAASALKGEAGKDAAEIIDILNDLRGAALRMNGRMAESLAAAQRYSRHSIIIAILLSVMLSSIVLIVTMRSVAKPINKLVAGIERVSSGDYSSKVDVTSKDEIGFVAETFNAMTENLNKAAEQNEALLQELRELNRNLERRVRQATEDLERTHENMLRIETLAVAGAFASGVVHELATPLSTLMTSCQMIKRRAPEDDGLEKYFGLAEKELERCRTVLRGMLDFIRVPKKEKTLTDINALISEAMILMAFGAKNKNVSVKESLDPAIPHIMAVHDELRQVFMNIIVNALQAMPEGGELSVSTSTVEAGEKVVLSVGDTGPGIPENDLGKIFKPFYTTKKTGTGLGLSISNGIVMGHGGDITVESECGKGTVFHIYLPVTVCEVAPVPEGKSSC